jgi:DNA-binding response OmpR family regulator
MKILLIEDDNFFREFYSSKLKEKKVEVAEAPDGEEGLKLIDTFQPDLILLDLIMPKKDGFEVLEAMKKKGLTDIIPVLVFSTLSQDQDVEKAMSLGARDYLNKSYFDFNQLFAKVVQLSNKN